MQAVVKKCFSVRVKDLSDETKNEIYFKNTEIDAKKRHVMHEERKRWEGSVPPDFKLLKPK